MALTVPVEEYVLSHRLVVVWPLLRQELTTYMKNADSSLKDSSNYVLLFFFCGGDIIFQRYP